MNTFRSFMLLLTAMFSSFSAQSAVIDLASWVFNIDGTVYESGYYPVGVDPLPTSVTGTLDSSGLGTLSTEITGAGDHNFTLMLDYEIDEYENTFYNEYGAASGSLAAGQSWEIDESFFGDIYWNTLNATLDDTNNVPNGFNDDVSFALGWDFTLEAGESATIDFFISDVLDTTDFYLSHNDAETGPAYNELASIFFWSDISITGGSSGSTNVPEPSTVALLGIGLLGVVMSRRRRVI